MESSLSLKKKDFESKVGVFLGAGRGSDFGDTAWTARQQSEIDDCIQSGLRRFYFPPLLPGSSVAYSWSFLKPVVTLALASGSQKIDLPDDFGYLEGDVTISDPASSYFLPIQQTGVGVILKKFSELPTASGRPQILAVEAAKGTTSDEGQRFRFWFWPEADQAYDMRFQYNLLPAALSGNRPYCYGGMPHVETILESCLAVAEQRRDDTVGVHYQAFMERLAASVSYDQNLKPQFYGYAGDRSGQGRRYSRSEGYTITFNGVSYP